MTARPVVLLLHYTFPGIVGGVETVMAHHAAGLRVVADVGLVAGRGRAGVAGVSATRIRLLDSLHPAVVRVGRGARDGPPGSEFGRLRRSLVESLAPHLRGADRVVLHNVTTLGFNLPLLAALHDLAPALPAGRLVAWVHDLAPDTWLHSPGAAPDQDPRRLLGRPLPGARYVAVSEERRALIAQRLGLPSADVRVVPNGVDVPGVLRLSPAGRDLADRLGLASADPLLVLPARLVRRKRVELAIDAAEALRRRGRGARLIVTGGPDPHDPDAAAYLAELRTRVARAGGSDVLLWDLLARTADDRLVADLYALADALIFPSLSEGFGMPLLEAAATRLPIVCTDLSVFHSIAADAATYVPVAGDGDDFADAVARALAAGPASALASRVRRGSDWRRIVAEQVIPAILG